MVSSFSERIECSFRREHHLIVICVEVAPDHNAFYGWHRRADHVVDVRQELCNSDFAFLSVLSCLSLSMAVSNQIALNVPNRRQGHHCQS